MKGANCLKKLRDDDDEVPYQWFNFSQDNLVVSSNFVIPLWQLAMIHKSQKLHKIVAENKYQIISQ